MGRRAESRGLRSRELWLRKRADPTKQNPHPSLLPRNGSHFHFFSAWGFTIKSKIEPGLHMSPQTQMESLVKCRLLGCHKHQILKA